MQLFKRCCGMWSDHRSSEFERNELERKYKEESRIALSCARIIYEYCGGEKRFPQFDDRMEAGDKVDSGNFTISNYQLMEKPIDACRTMTTEEILAIYRRMPGKRAFLALIWDSAKRNHGGQYEKDSGGYLQL